MKIYHYSKKGEFLKETDARKDPIEGVALIPRFATAVKPPPRLKGFTAVWKGAEWAVIEDHRGSTVYLPPGYLPSTIKELGPYPDGASLSVPREAEFKKKKIAKKEMLRMKRGRRINNEIRKLLGPIGDAIDADYDTRDAAVDSAVDESSLDSISES